MKFTLFLLFSSLYTLAAWGQTAFTGFEGIAWGSDPETVSKKLLEGGQDRAYKGDNVPDPSRWNDTPLAKLTQFQIGPPTAVKVYTGKYNERIECYFSNNELGMILYSPNGQMMFSPDRLIKSVDDIYNGSMQKKVRMDVPILIEWGRVDPKMEYIQTFEWENDEGLVRLFCKTWPVDDKRQVFRIIYTSKIVAAKSEQLIAAEAARLAAEQRAKEAERARRQEEALRKRREAQAEAAARRAAANGNTN